MFRKKLLRVMSSILLIFILGLFMPLSSQAGMKTRSSLSVSGGKDFPITITDKMGNVVRLEEKPEKIAAISGTFLGLLYDLGGKSICTAEIGGGSPVPDDSVRDLPTVGRVYNPDIEKILALQPDLVITQFGLQNNVIPALKQSSIPVLTFHMRTYQDVLEHLRVIGKIIDENERAESLIKNMEQKKQAIVAKLPKEPKKVVILYVTSKDVSVKLPNSIAGDVCDILGLKNIAAGFRSDSMGGETIPFSLEFIIEKDPDVILITSMLRSDELAKKMIAEQLGKDPIWKEIRAVKTGNLVYLPQSHFLYCAGADYVTGIEYVAREVYPEIYYSVGD